MKFLCPSCKAKYQIGDEKVAGRSVRMKCRKCGYVIQVSSIAGMGDALPGSEPPSAIDPAGDAAVPKPSAVEPAASAKKPAAPPTRPAVARSAASAPAASAPAVGRAPLPAPKAPPAKSSPMKPAAPAAATLSSQKKTIQGGVS